MRSLSTLSRILLVLGALMLVCSLVVTVAVQNNEYVQNLKSFGIKITPDTIKDVLDGIQGFSLSGYVEDEFGVENLALKVYAITPVLYTIGGVMTGLGLLGLIVSLRDQRK